jgi:hypothetical protein
MGIFDDIAQPHLGIIEVDGKRYNVSCHIAFDGIEYVGRLWFADETWDDIGVPDRGAIPGRTKEEVLASAQTLNADDFVQRYRRALSEKRRYHGLRKCTDDVLAKIRYLNQVAISMRAGLLDVDGAAQEIDLTERQLHELVNELRVHAGVES